MAARISIVVPCYNVVDEVSETLNSIRAQTLTDWEAILVNDGSTDSTCAKLSRFASEECRARVINQVNTGLSGARNAGMAAAEGDRVLFLDAGDVLEPEALSVLDGLLAQYPDAGAACGGWRFIGPNGEDRDWFGWPPKQRLAFEDFTTTNPVNTDSMLIRREWLTQAGEFDVTLPGCEDWHFWMRMAHLGCRFITTPVPVSRYRMAINSMSRRTDLMLEAGLRVIRQADAYWRSSGNKTDSYKDEGLREAEADWYAYCMACAFVQGRMSATLPLIAKTPDMMRCLDPRQLARRLYFAVPYMSCSFPGQWPSVWPSMKSELVAWLAEIAELAGVPMLAADCLAHLRQLIGNEQIVEQLSRHIKENRAGRRLVVYGHGRNGRELLNHLCRIGIEPDVADDADGANGIARFLNDLDHQLIIVTPWESDKMCQRLIQAGARHRDHFIKWSDFLKPIDLDAKDEISA